MQLFLNVLVFNVWLWKGEKMKNWGGEEKQGRGFLSPLEVTSAREGGACNSCCPPPCPLLLCDQKQRYLEDMVLFAHHGSHKLCIVYAKNTATGLGR